MIGIDAYIFYIYAVLRPNHSEAVLVELRDIAGNADGIKITLRLIRIRFVFLRDNHNHFFTYRNAA